MTESLDRGSRSGYNEQINWFSREKVKNALRKMKKGKAVGPDELPVEAWKCMGEMGDRVFDQTV